MNVFHCGNCFSSPIRGKNEITYTHNKPRPIGMMTRRTCDYVLVKHTHHLQWTALHSHTHTHTHTHVLVIMCWWSILIICNERRYTVTHTHTHTRTCDYVLVKHTHHLQWTALHSHTHTHTLMCLVQVCCGLVKTLNTCLALDQTSTGSSAGLLLHLCWFWYEFTDLHRCSEYK